MKNERMFRLKRYNRPVNAFCARLFFFFLSFHKTASPTFHLQRRFIYGCIFLYSRPKRSKTTLAFHEQHSPIYRSRYNRVESAKRCKKINSLCSACVTLSVSYINFEWRYVSCAELGKITHLKITAHVSEPQARTQHGITRSKSQRSRLDVILVGLVNHKFEFLRLSRNTVGEVKVEVANRGITAPRRCLSFATELLITSSKIW